jgi:hypothetical protein
MTNGKSCVKIILTGGFSMRALFKNTAFYIILMLTLTLFFYSCSDISESSGSVSFGLNSNILASKVAALYSENDDNPTEGSNEEIALKIIGQVYYSYDDISKKEDFTLISLTGDEVLTTQNKSKDELVTFYKEKLLDKKITINELPLEKKSRIQDEASFPNLNFLYS